MFQDLPKQLKPNLRSKGRISTKKIDPQVLKPLVQLVDQTTFNQNIQQLQNEFGINKIDRQSETFKDLRHYVKILLAYPNRSLAGLHRQSHRLGNYDIQISKSQTQTSTNQARTSQSKYLKQLQNCPCCGLQRQESQLKICSTTFKNLQVVGISTYMLFRTMRNLLFFLLLILIVFGVYSFATNIRASNIWKQQNENLFTNTILISLGSKIYLSVNEDYSDLLIWQVWLGFSLVVMFMFAYVWMEHVQVTQIQEVQHRTITVSDYSIVINGVPIGVTKQQIQRNINSHYQKKIQKNGMSENIKDKYLKVVKINTGSPASIEKSLKIKQKQQLRFLDETVMSYRSIIVSWIRQLQISTQFITPPKQRRQVEQNYLKKLKEKKNKIKQITKQVKQSYQNKKNDMLTDCFVTFQSTQAKQMLLAVTQHSSFDKFLHYLTFSIYQKKTKMTFRTQGQQQIYKVSIKQASQPQDIIWQNIGLKTSNLMLRKCVTFFFTGIVLVASFAAVYVLSTVQVDNQSNRYISFLISLCIAIFNLIITLALSIFTVYQLNSTYTDYQSSYAFKAIVAQLINTIIIPILVNRFLKKENYIYTASGLAEDIFLLGLTNAFINPLLKFFDVSYFLTKYLLRLYYDRPSKKMFMTQIELNKIYELMLFESGTQYIYIISLYLWTCFFMSLQPIIIVFSMLGLLLNYWGQKYSLLHLCKRPVPGRKILYDTMVQFVYAGGLFYSLGSLTFINLIPKDIFKAQLNFALIANLLAVSISALSLFIPYSYLYEICFSKQKQLQNNLYQEERIFFPSEYDRANPVTCDKALQEYFQYVNSKKSDIQKFDKPQMQQFFKLLSKQCRNIYTNYQQKLRPLQFATNEIREIYSPQVQMIHPQAIQNYLIENLVSDVVKEKSQKMLSYEQPSSASSVKSQKDNIIKSSIKKGRSWFKNTEKEQKLKKINVQNQMSLERLTNNDDLMMDDMEVDKKQKVVQNNGNNIWKIIANNIHQNIVHNSDPLTNPYNYSSSPYSPQCLQAFKLRSNDLYHTAKIQAQTGQSYQNVAQMYKTAKRNVKKGNSVA